ncbi:MAG: hypothetical protein ACYSWU_25975, partial [Planctomycetota bacterium]
LLQDVQQRLHKVRQELEALSRKRTTAHLFGSLSAAIEKTHLSVQEVRAFVAQVESSQHTDEPLVLTFGLMMEELLESETLPQDVPREYPYLCDWLELNLVKHLRSIITTFFHYTQPSERWGDGLSVRIVFPGLDDTELDEFNLPWWEILEAANYWEIFGERYTDAFPDLPKRESFGWLEVGQQGAEAEGVPPVCSRVVPSSISPGRRSVASSLRPGHIPQRYPDAGKDGLDVGDERT